MTPEELLKLRGILEYGDFVDGALGRKIVYEAAPRLIDEIDRLKDENEQLRAKLNFIERNA